MIRSIVLRYASGLMRVGATAALAAAGVAAPAATGLADPGDAPAASTTCQLGAGRDQIQHVVYVQFDNVHFTRDNPNVPSDLEQMPHLLNFVTGNGTLLTQHHTPLIAHTGTNFVSSLTGVYPDRHGANVSNGFRYFNADGTSSSSTMFAYWTGRVVDFAPNPPDNNFNMLTADGHNAPAPWVAYTRAGCNVGFSGMANVILENTSTDVASVFGTGSPQAAEAAANPDQAAADFVGIGIHCAASDALCSTANGGVTDVLPQEPGGYSGFNGLFGHKYVAPQVSPGGPLHDLNGNVIQDSSGRVGFPGFDGLSAPVSLGYAAAMQEHGVPVTFSYISDAHDSHPRRVAMGPGEAEYVQVLKNYDHAFDTFFTRLQNDGITQQNTLFVVTADEGDHFIGGPPSPANCDGVSTACTYPLIGELAANLTGLLATQAGVATNFAVHADTAPTIYIRGNPARDALLTRTFGRALLGLDVTNLISNQTEKLAKFVADSVEMKLLHMVTADAARTPTLTLFAKPDYFVTTGASTCPTTPGGCVSVGPAFAWNHGAVGTDMNTTFLGLVGPGVQSLHVKNDVFSDHADTRVTMLALLGLKDDYSHQGRVLAEVLKAPVLSLGDSRSNFLKVARMFKKINAPVGPLGLDSLAVSNNAIDGGATVYAQLEDQLTSITTRRDALALQMEAALEGAEFKGQPLREGDADSMVDRGQALLNEVHRLAGTGGNDSDNQADN
jgi:hypothetical protein